MEMYNLMLDHFGPRNWWPGDTELEIMVGAILTQNTNWKNVEKAIKNLKENNLLYLERLNSVSFPELADNIRESPWKCLLYGFITLIMVPIAAIMIAFTLIGIPIALIILLLYVLAVYLSKVFAALYLGKLIIPKSKGRIAPMALGVAAYLLLANLPFIGGLAKMLALLLGLGALAVRIFTKKEKPSKKKATKRKTTGKKK